MPAPLLPASQPHAPARLTGILGAALIACLGVFATAVVSSGRSGPAPAATTWHRSPRPGLSVAVGPSGTAVSITGFQLSLAAQNAGSRPWRRVPGGMFRPTPSGTETVTVSDRQVEESVTVRRRHGPTDWRWRIDASGATSRLGSTGVVSFTRPPQVLPFAIQPVRILDARGADITPAGLHWTLGRDRRGPWLGLRLDDSGLSLPYTIDPAIIFDAATSGANTSAPASPAALTINVPAGVAANDLLVAQVVVNGGTSSTITPPTGWTLTRRTNNTTSVGEASFRKVASSSEPASYTWTITDSLGCPTGDRQHPHVHRNQRFRPHGHHQRDQLRQLRQRGRRAPHDVGERRAAGRFLRHRHRHHVYVASRHDRAGGLPQPVREWAYGRNGRPDAGHRRLQREHDRHRRRVRPLRHPAGCLQPGRGRSQRGADRACRWHQRAWCRQPVGQLRRLRLGRCVRDIPGGGGRRRRMDDHRRRHRRALPGQLGHAGRRRRLV